jgi:hypothetical protein
MPGIFVFLSTQTATFILQRYVGAAMFAENSGYGQN